MSSSDLKTNPKPQHGAHSHKQTSKYSLLVRLTIFMVWIVGIVLLISLAACHQNETIIFVIKVGS